MKIVVASLNPVKIEAVRQGAALMFPNRQLEVTGYSVPSEVADQPMTDDETRLGAFNRVKNLGLLQPMADLVVAIEGGCADVPDAHGAMRMTAFAWVVTRDKHGLWGESRSASFVLPEAVAVLIRAGEEMGTADDRVFGTSNSKQEKGGTGLLTGGAISRTEFYVAPVALALIPMHNPKFYSGI